jgi:hypothetical protein
MISTPYTVGYYACNVAKKNEISRSHRTHGGVVRCLQKLVGKHEGKRLLENPRRRGWDKIKMGVK